MTQVIGDERGLLGADQQARHRELPHIAGFQPGRPPRVGDSPWARENSLTSGDMTAVIRMFARATVRWSVTWEAK
jgi:hypothetical protein